MKTFGKGGIHPPENKLSANKPIRELPLPEEVFIPMSQHIGAPAELLVKKGDEVKVGTLIGKSAGFVSANIYSSVSGKVTKIDLVNTAGGYKQNAVRIEREGDVWEESIDRSEALIKETNLSGAEIIAKIESAGIVGLGGATFPLHVKLQSGIGKADSLIINGTECEPYLTDDHALMLAKPHEIMVGVQLLMKAIHVKKAYIGIENNKRNAIDLLSQLTGEYAGIEVVPLKTRYPQGGEKQLIDAILKRQVPAGKLPADVGCVVVNVGTTFAAYEAVQKNKPLVERLVTVTGKSLAEPADLKVRLGTMVSELVACVGGMPEETGKVILGGPMMGRAITTLDTPVTKGVSGVLLMKEEDSRRKAIQPCIRCGKCVAACAMSLIPNYLANYTQKEDWEQAEKFNITDCMECGSCAYSCPAHRPLLDYIRIGKVNVLTLIRNRKQ